jgi:hypothetical protein
MTTLATLSARVLATGAVATALAVAAPVAAFAQTFAYVNTSGDVATVEANDPMTAINIAPNRAVHSGVLLLVNPSDGIVGDGVSGI